MADTPKYLDSNPPRLSEAEAVASLAEIFGRKGTASDIYSDRDQNYLIRMAGGEKAILKIYNADELEASVEFQTQALSHLEHHCQGVDLPRLITTANRKIPRRQRKQTAIEAQAAS